MTLPRIAVAWLGLALMVFAAAARADDKDEATALFQQGVALFKETRFEEAADKFEEAYAMRPTYKLLFNIGQARAAARQYDRAMWAFERYLVQGGDDLTIERRDEVAKEMDRLRPMLGYFEVKAPDGLLVRVDGRERGTTPLKGKQLLTAGMPHKVELLQDGAVVHAQDVEVPSGVAETIAFEGKAKVAPATAVQPAPAEPRSEPAPREEAATPAERAAKLKTGGWVTAGLGAAVLVAGGAVGIAASVQGKALEDVCPGGTCAPARQDEIDSLASKELSADILLGVGAAAAVTGIVLVVLGYRGKESAVTAMPGPGGAVVSVRF